MFNAKAVPDKSGFLSLLKWLTCNVYARKCFFVVVTSVQRPKK